MTQLGFNLVFFGPSKALVMVFFTSKYLSSLPVVELRVFSRLKYLIGHLSGDSCPLSRAEGSGLIIQQQNGQREQNRTEETPLRDGQAALKEGFYSTM
jgi:hypothetical protein